MGEPDHVFAVRLPLFDEEEQVGAALESPRVMASGALVSKEGDQYWIHSVEDLAALGSNHKTLGAVRARGRELKRADFGDRKAAGIRLVEPRAHDVLRDIFSDLGLEGLPLIVGKTALVFSRAGAGYVVVQTTYHCSMYGEGGYNQNDYDANNGKCPKHPSWKLVLD